MDKKPYVTAVITAAGNSTRMNMRRSKQTLSINGLSVIARSIRAFENSTYVDEIIVVCRNSERQFINDEITRYKFKKVSKLVAGGETRQQSVFNGIKQATATAQYFAIHDGARCFITTQEIDNTIKTAFKYKAVAISLKVNDTVKIVDSSDFITRTLNRDELRLVQTPQVFEKELYLKAMSFAIENKLDFTDDCQLIERIGSKVKLTAGSATNKKITVPEDLNGMNITNSSYSFTRIGQGYDVHKLVPNRKLILGGVTIPHNMGLLGHSDADVLLHAVIDSLLGALVLGDIGKLFPDNDDTYKNANSLKLLELVEQKISEKGYKIINIDATVIAQAPKLAPYIDEMRENIARTLNTDIQNISVKATTEEGLGFTGCKEGIAAHCICNLMQYRIANKL